MRSEQLLEQAKRRRRTSAYWRQPETRERACRGDVWRRADPFSQNVSEAGRQTRHDPPDGAQNRKALNFKTKPPYRV